jgi:hypothetical protein
VVAFGEPGLEALARLRRRVGPRHAHGVETERLRARDERVLQGGAGQKSRSA